jgi:GT2 family glycosyltransferase
MSETSSRCLLAVLVYNGRSFVPDCLLSAAKVRDATDGVDVLVLDDCSPDPGWSQELRDLCRELKLRYYRTPHNLGIPRNMNMALLSAIDGNYDHVIIANSDLVLPRNLVHRLVAVAESDPTIGSVTAWSNSASVFSLVNPGQSPRIARSDTVDWLSDVVAGEFGLAAVDVPTGVGFCMLIPVSVVRRVGLFDPVFGRGYCEEVDWCLRSLALGFRVTLTPAVFVYHAGRGSNEQAGLVAPGDTTVWANERIIDLRYPFYRSQIDSYLSSEIQTQLQERASRRIVTDGARLWGYVVEASWLPRFQSRDDVVHFTVEPDGRRALVSGQFLGYRTDVPLEGDKLLPTLTQMIGRPPLRITAFDRGRLADLLREQAGLEALQFDDHTGYPERVGWAPAQATP